MKIRSKLFGGFTIMISITFLLGITSFVNTAQLGGGFEFLVEHDLNVLQNAQKLQKLVVDAETGQRGFVIVGDESFLEPYYFGEKEFHKLIEIERKLVSDNLSQVERLDRIEVLFEEWQEKAAIPEIELARNVHEESVSFRSIQDVLSEGAGKSILDELRVLLDESVKREQEEGELDQQLLLVAIEKDLVDRETGQRGFLITGEEEFLEPYNLGNENLAKHLDELRLLIEEEEEEEEEGGGGQLIITDKIIELANRWETEAAIPEIELARTVHQSATDLNYLKELLSEGTGKYILDELRVLLDESVKREQDEGELDQQLLLTAIEKDLVDRETGQRGFLITGEEEFLEPYNLGNENLAKHLDELRLLIEEEEEEEEEGGGGQLIITDKIIELANRWETEAAIPEIEARRTIDANPTVFDVASLLKAGTGKNILDQIRVEFDEFIEIENNLKDKRFETALKIEFNTQLSVIGFTIASAISGIMVSILVFRAITNPIVKLQKASIAIAEGHLDAEIDTTGNDEISDLAKSFNEMRTSIKENIELEKKLATEKEKVKNERLTAIGELAGRLAHDLRNPLSIIKNDVDMIREINVDVPDRILSRIDRAIDRMSHQVESVMDFVRQRPVISDHYLLDNILKSVKDMLKIPNNIQINFPETGVTLWCGEKEAEILFYNLLMNSIQEIGDKEGQITIRVKETQNQIEVEIEDSGNGIPPQNLDVIFNPLFTTKQEGTGLGLSSCKNIIEKFGGTLSVQNNPTRFLLIFPKKF